MDYLMEDVAKNLGLERETVEAVVDEMMLQLHKQIFEYKGLNGDYIGETLHYQINEQAYYHLLGFLDQFSEKYIWDDRPANEYLLRLGGRIRWAPYRHQMLGWKESD